MCGRVADGVCIRLYGEEDHDRRAPFTDPEVLRSSLAAVILRAASLGLGTVEDFPFLDPPSPRAIADGYALLAELGAVDEEKQLTATGRELARLPSGGPICCKTTSIKPQTSSRLPSRSIRARPSANIRSRTC